MKAKKVIAMLLAATLSVTAFTGCAINKTATVATLDKEDIKLGLVNFMIRYQEANFASRPESRNFDGCPLS